MKQVFIMFCNYQIKEIHVGYSEPFSVWHPTVSNPGVRTHTSKVQDF